MSQGCLMTSAPAEDGRRFSPEEVVQAYEPLNVKRHLEIKGHDTPLTNVWLNRQESGIVELWIAWEEDVADA